METRRRKAAILPMLVFCVVVAGASSALSQVTMTLDGIKVRWPSVIATVDVTCIGQPASTMTPQNFQVRENGQNMLPLTVSYHDVVLNQDVSTGLVLDASGTTAGSWNAGIKSGASAYVNMMDGVKDEATVITYSSMVMVLQMMTASKPLLLSAINSLPASGPGAVWDGAYGGILETVNNSVNSRRIVIVVNDGVDNASSRTVTQVINLAITNRIPVYTIGCGTAYDPSLVTLAVQTGGMFYQAAQPGDLAGIFTTIASSFQTSRRQCEVSYNTRCPDGGNRNLDIDLVNYCGGQDSESGSFAVPLLPALFTNVELDIAETFAMAGETVTLPLNLTTALGGLQFSPCAFTLKYDPSLLTLLSATAAPGMILDGIPITVMGPAGSKRINVQGGTVPASIGALMQFTFQAGTPLDTVYCPVSIEQFSFTGGCIAPVTHPGGVLIDVNPQPVISASGPLAFCDGGSVTLTAPAGYSRYEWSNGDTTRSITVSSSGSYSVTVHTPSGKSGTSAAVTVTVYAPPRPKIHIGGSVHFCEGRSVTLEVIGAPAYTALLWSTGETTESITITQSGEYSATVTDMHGCNGTSEAVSVVVTPASLDLGQPDSLTLCEGDTLRLDAGPGFTSYLWSTGDTLRRIAVVERGSYHVTTRDRDGCIARSDTVHVSQEVMNVPRISASGPIDLCPGESVALEVSETFAAYRWSTGEETKSITVTAPGVYSVTAFSKAGCQAASEEVTVTMSAAPDIDPPGPIQLCKGGTVVLDAGEGYGSYSWSNGERTRVIRVNSAGAFTVTVTLGRCTMTSSAVRISLVETLVPVITHEGDTELCDGETLLLDAGEYLTYRWSTGDTTRRIMVARAGNYFVDVSDAFGCSGRSDPVSVSVFPLPAPVIRVSGETTICEGDTVILDAGDGYSFYLWSNGATVQRLSITRAGTYSVTVTTEHGCEGTSEVVQVTVLPAPTVPVITRASDELESSEAATYQWFVDGKAIPGGTGRRIAIGGDGRYRVRITNSDGCSSISDEYIVITTNVARHVPAVSVDAYPDPNNGTLSVRVNTDRAERISMVVTNVLGQIVSEYRSDLPAESHFQTVNLQHQPPGLYLLHVTGGDTRLTRKLIRR